MCLFDYKPSAIIWVASFPKLLKDISTCYKVLFSLKQFAIAFAQPRSPSSPSWFKL
jgi:hypothetical protein